MKKNWYIYLFTLFVAAAVLYSGCRNLKNPSSSVPASTAVPGTATNTGTITPTATITPTFTNTKVLSPTPTFTITETATVTPVLTATSTSTITPTFTATVCATDTGYKLMTSANVRFRYKIVNCGQAMDCILSTTGTGWVAVGWHGNTATSGAKSNRSTILIGYFSGGSPFMRDDFNTSGNTHVDDTTRSGLNDISALTGTESGGVTELRFRYPLNTGDPNDTELIPGHFYNFFMAYHQTADNYTTQHTDMGVVANTQY